MPNLSHAQKGRPDMFTPYGGRLANSPNEILKQVEHHTFMKPIASLKLEQFEESGLSFRIITMLNQSCSPNNQNRRALHTVGSIK